MHAHAVPICSGIEYSDQVTHFSLRLCSVVLSIPLAANFGVAFYSWRFLMR